MMLINVHNTYEYTEVFKESFKSIPGKDNSNNFIKYEGPHGNLFSLLSIVLPALARGRDT